jgi:hypothetical protein
MVALCCHVADLAAQQRGEVQVTARVVASAPSRQSLADAIDLPRDGRARGLYVVRESGTTTRPRDRDLDRPRRVVTIAFLAN